MLRAHRRGVRLRVRQLLHRRGQRPTRIGQAFLAIDPGALAGDDVYFERVETLVARDDRGPRSAPAGRAALRLRESARANEGVAVPAELLERIRALAGERVPMPKCDSFHACLRTPFATLGITATRQARDRHPLPRATVPAKAPKRERSRTSRAFSSRPTSRIPHYGFDLPLKLSGTHHRLQVWEAMCAYPRARCARYGEVAARARLRRARAVGGACGANPMPGRRSVPSRRSRASHGIGGFMGASGEGFELGIKRWLLEHEGAL